MKALWLLFFPIVQGLRPMHLNPRHYIDRPTLLTIVTQAAYLGAVWSLAGWWAIGYLLLSLFASIGLHPLGARWIQEHYTFSTTQETFSYYGQGNRVAFNVGFHNEHHDFPSVPWNHLPAIRRIGAEHYDTLQSHRSWTRLLLQFLFDPRYGMTSRVVRPREAARVAAAG
jgi:sphingolipid delta-4 desaturase